MGRTVLTLSRATVRNMRAEVQQAIRLLQQGDESAVEQALSLLQNTIFSFSMRVCGQREDAEDTMQEVLLKSVPQLSRFENPKALVVWLYKVAKTRCLMSRRKSKFAPQPDLSLDELMPSRSELKSLSATSLNPEAHAIRDEEVARLRNAIQKLPPPYRIVLVLRDMEGLTDEEVAEVTGLRSGTVRVRLHRARLFVRNEFMRTLRKSNTARTRSAAKADSLRRTRCKAMFAELSNYLDRKLDESLCEKLERHLEGCEPCQAFLATLEATVEGCRKTTAEAPDKRRAVALREQILADYERLFGRSISS